MAQLKVLMFAGARDAVGSEYLTVEVQPPLSMGQLKSIMTLQQPSLASIVRYSRLAVDREFVEDQFVIGSESLSSEIALIPPVSGG